MHVCTDTHTHTQHTHTTHTHTHTHTHANVYKQVTLAALNLGQKAIEALGAGYLLWKTSFMVMAGN